MNIGKPSTTKALFGTNQRHSLKHLDKRRLRRALTDNRLVITQHFTERTVTPGGEISMQCAATGDRPPQFVWERDGVTVSSNTDPRVRVEDGGLYACIAKEGEHVASSENRLDFYVTSPSAEMVRRSFEIQVIEAPILEDLLLGNNLQEGQIVNIYCNLRSGDLQIHFEWLKDGKRISSNLKVVERSSELFSALVIKKVALEHCGTYTCVASNHVAKVNKSTQLYIKVAPKWLEEPSNSSLLLGRKGIVSCSASGYPQPQVHWMKKDALLGTWQPVLELAGGGILSLPNGSLSYTGHLYQYRGSFALSGLSAGTWYVLRITATNEAGSVTTVYNYATKNEDGSEVGPPSEIFDINMLVIVLSSILLAVCLICCAYILVKRQRNVNLTGYRDSITVDKSESGNITANTSHSNLANVKENSMNAQNRIYSAPIHVRNNSKHGDYIISELYEISPYAQFAVGFRTFGHAENNDVPRHIKHRYDTGSEDNETR
ncbi:unnamed protein product [Danaus chrysippus]|uniref:(African queen) hypothetical protein n=1 Tax=Danaus chrysippus TaxID=151541 RepID=A0A8J2QWQ0_9NEOP|nr:unnamed protein product [Danaus chrysippus]